MSRLRLLLVLAALAPLGCGGKPNAKPATEPAPPPTTAAKPTADPNAPLADRTADYWQAVAKSQEVAARKFAALADLKPEAVNPLLTDAAKQIDELPTDRVDPDALAVGKSLSEALRKFSDKSPDVKALFTFLADAAGKARTAKAALGAKYGREFADLTSTSKEPAFRIAHDLGRPNIAQQLSILKQQATKLVEEIKPVNDKLTEEITTRDRLQGEADTVRGILKEQTSDVELKKARQEVLDDAVKQVETQKKVIDALTKELNALRTRRGELERMANDLTAILKEGDPEKLDTLPLDRLDRLRTQTERVYEKLGK